MYDRSGRGCLFTVIAADVTLVTSMSELNSGSFQEKPGQLISGHNNGGNKKRWGLVATGLVGGSLVALYAIATPFVTPALRKVCLPFVPATPAQIENVLKVLQQGTGRFCNREQGTLVDIGSGDGRIVIAAAKKGFRAVGFELNPWLVWYSRYRAWREGVNHNTAFYISDLWKVSFSQYTNVVIFGVPQMMAQLEEKLQGDLQSTAKVVACRFPFPTWVPDDTAGEGIDTVWVYNAKSFKSLQAERGRTPENRMKYREQSPRAVADEPSAID